MVGSLPERFKDSLAVLCPDWPERRFLIAFSGGLDSTALLHLTVLLLPLGQLAAAHLNHCLRGEAADVDQNFTNMMADRLGLVFFTEACDVAALAGLRRKGTEEAARQARYDFLQKVAGHWGADYILTAHQADDQAETMLMNFIKGAGSGGLAGIHPRRNIEGGITILRPLLPFSRQELQAWLEARGQNWREDLSNNDHRYLRNLVRQKIMPGLEILNPRLTEALARTSVVLRDEENFWRNHLKKLWVQAVIESDADENAVSFHRAALADLSIAEQRRLIYEGLLTVWRRRPLSPEPLTFTGVEMVLQMLKAHRHSGLDLPGGLRAELTPAALIITPASRLK